MQKDPLIDKFFNIVDDAVALNIAHQIRHDDNRRYIGAPHWLHDYATVDINVGRQSGKTLYINKRMTPVDLVIVHNTESIRQFEGKDNVVTIETMFNYLRRDGMYRGRTNPHAVYNKIYIDEPAMCLAHGRRDQFYSFAGGVANMIIMLGTPVR